MCGISGIISLKGRTADSRSLHAMNNSLRHRGPDGEGFVFYDGTRCLAAYGADTPDNIRSTTMPHAPVCSVTDLHDSYVFGFGHRRLAILDLGENGHQPLCSGDENLWITYNGEIYNYPELRSQLQLKGHIFRTRTDTEVILAAYKEWGVECLTYFNGMWAFVLFDKKKNIIFGSRDRFGVKPLYYYKDREHFIFASEQKALLKFPAINTGVNQRALADYFVSGKMEQEEEGMFLNIFELFPAQAFRIEMDSGTFHKWNWYSLPANEQYEPFDSEKFNGYKKQTEQLIREAIRIRLRSDVPVGSCLSGGIDSSSIVGVMRALRQEEKDESPLHTFTCSFPGMACDETSWAQIAAKQAGTEWHHTSPQLPELLKDMEQLVYCQDSPLWSTSTYAQYRVMNLVKKQGIKVILDGQGGDELFAGYSPYYSWYTGDKIKNREWRSAFASIQALGSFPSALSGITKEYLKENLLHRLPAGTQMRINSSYFSDIAFLQPSLLDAYRENLKSRQQKPPSSLNGILQKEFINTRLKLYLKCEDRCSMWHSVESRTPFSDDHPLIESIFQIPGNYKIHEGTFKYLLKESMKSYLPEPVYQRKDKMGYATPNNEWVASIREEMKDYFNDSLKPYLKVDKLMKEYNSFFDISGKPEDGRIFKFMAFAVWMKVFKM